MLGHKKISNVSMISWSILILSLYNRTFSMPNYFYHNYPSRQLLLFCNDSSFVFLTPPDFRLIHRFKPHEQTCPTWLVFTFLRLGMQYLLLLWLFLCLSSFFYHNYNHDVAILTFMDKQLVQRARVCQLFWYFDEFCMIIVNMKVMIPNKFYFSAVTLSQCLSGHHV